jgi:hypothetical protein
MRPRLATLVLATFLGSACKQPSAAHDGGRETSPPSLAVAKPPPKFPEVVHSRVKSKGRVVALGDVHGDMRATLRALSLAGVVDEKSNWTGGQTVLVQTGDILDRGDDEQEIIDLFERLKVQAKDAGGAVHVLNGNHELMNVAGDFRYVTPGGFLDFEDLPDDAVRSGVRRGSSKVGGDPLLDRLPKNQRARFAAFRPGGSYAKKIAAQPVALIVDDTVFAHGGVLPDHVQYGIDRMNDEVREWMAGRKPTGRRVATMKNSPVWSRHYSDRPDAQDCRLLDTTLAALGVKRMVVGHTVQRTIRPACGRRVWRIDVGMASHYGGRPEILEIEGGQTHPVRASP